MTSEVLINQEQITKQTQIFVISSDEDTKSMLCKIFRYENYNVRQARSIRDTIVKMQYIPKDVNIVCIIDFKLVDGTGEDLARYLVHSGYNTTQILVTCGTHPHFYEREQYIVESIPDGLFVAIFYKPIPIDELLEKVKEFS